MRRKESGRIMSGPGNEKGATIVVVAIALVVILGFAGLALDVGYWYLVRNELQNAADAGALAGAQVLYINNGTQINPGVSQVATGVASQNPSEGGVTVVSSVERGHWSFATRTFTSREGTAMQPVNLWDVTSAQLDADLNFINAVRVVTERRVDSGTGRPAEPFFARLFGIQGFQIQAEAVAYIGFAGTLEPLTADQPIAICRESLLINNAYSCSVGRMINSGASQNSAITGETGGWTDFNQAGNPCQGGTNANAVRDLVCGSGNPNPLVLGANMAAQGGEISTAFQRLVSCWRNAADTDGDGIPDRVWPMTLPVIQCCDDSDPPNCNNPGPCNIVRGAVVVNIVWIQRQNDPHYNDVPRRMEGWDGSGISDGRARWNSFASYFRLQNADGSTATYMSPTIYFLPDCNPHVPTGTSGGQNFGILARIPVLVH